MRQFVTYLTVGALVGACWNAGISPTAAVTPNSNEQLFTLDDVPPIPGQETCRHEMRTARNWYLIQCLSSGWSLLSPSGDFHPLSRSAADIKIEGPLGGKSEFQIAEDGWVAASVACLKDGSDGKVSSCVARWDSSGRLNLHVVEGVSRPSQVSVLQVVDGSHQVVFREHDPDAHQVPTYRIWLPDGDLSALQARDSSRRPQWFARTTAGTFYGAEQISASGETNEGKTRWTPIQMLSSGEIQNLKMPHGAHSASVRRAAPSGNHVCGDATEGSTHRSIAIAWNMKNGLPGALIPGVTNEEHYCAGISNVANFLVRSSSNEGGYSGYYLVTNGDAFKMNRALVEGMPAGAAFNHCDMAADGIPLCRMEWRQGDAFRMKMVLVQPRG